MPVSTSVRSRDLRQVFPNSPSAWRSLGTAVRRAARLSGRLESECRESDVVVSQLCVSGSPPITQGAGLMQTPHRFRSKQQLWTYSGLGIETRDSAQYHYVHRQLQRTKKPQQIRGLNQNHNHETKEILREQLPEPAVE